MRQGFAGIGVAAAAILAVALPTLSPGVSARQQRPAPSRSVPGLTRTADGRPDLQGVWRVWNLAKYDVERA